MKRAAAIAVSLTTCAAFAAPVIDTSPLTFVGTVPVAAPVVDTPPLTFAGAAPATAPVVDTAPLTFLGSRPVAAPVVDTSPLTFLGSPSSDLPRSIGTTEVMTAPLVWTGTARTAVGRVDVRTDALVWMDRPRPRLSHDVVTAPLAWSGPAHPPLTRIEAVTEPLAWKAGVPSPAATTPGLEIVDVPTGPRESRYLALDNASVEYDRGLTLRYRGLPESNGYGALFYMGQQPPRLAAWFYTLKSKPDGEWVRSSLPSYTGDWKACIGFLPQVTTNSPDLDRYEDCLDFVVAGPGSIGARPTLELPPDGIRAGKDAVIRYGGMPPANCEVGIYSPAGTLVTRHFTNRAETGTWTLRVAQPGPYELRIKYLGDAVRARMPLEVSP